MATFSQSPAPRRTHRHGSPVSGRTPPASRRRVAVGTSKPSSRMVTPSHAGDRHPFMHEDASVMSGMDVDENTILFTERTKTDMIFAKSEELSVTFYANLPMEVRQVLKNANFYGDSYSGEIDTLTGFALIVSMRTCFVWQHAQALKSTPTCYIFACPVDNSCPHHALVPYGQSREPGLILVSLRGEVRFWDSIGIGLAGGEHFSTTHLELKEGESISSLIRSDPQTYITATSTGRLFRLSLTSAGGKQHLHPRVFSRPQASSLSLSRLLPNLWSTAPPSIQSESGNISAIALGESNSLGKEIWSLVDTRIQKWNMSIEGWEEILLDEELAGIIRPAIRRAFSSAPADNSTLDLELLDLAVERLGTLVILVSYAGIEEGNAMDVGSHPRRIYALVRLAFISDIFKVENISSVPYQSTSRSGAPVHPRMSLISDGALISIQFGDAVALCSRESEYQDCLWLKSATDRTLGVGVVEAESALLVLTAATMMKVYVNLDAVQEFDSETGRAGLIKSIMTQAILYGSIPENPLHFAFPPEVDEESLMIGAEHLSRSVLESEPEIIRPNHDLTSQLSERKGRLSWLIRFINDNGGLTKMSQKSRQRLATDAEKLYACHQLWIAINEHFDRGATHSILSEAVYAYMEAIADNNHEDIIRAFFKYRVSDIGKLLPYILQAIQNSARDVARDLSVSLPEANKNTLTILKSALDYRAYNLGVYGIDLPMIKPWTSRPAVIDIVLALFDTTTKAVESPISDDVATKLKSELSLQLPALASILFSCILERLEWLESAVAADEPATERDKKELQDRFEQLRPEVLETLRVNGHIEEAFTLAENYRDFRSLASLCNKDTTYPPQNNPNAVRIQTYIERFREEFTTELYRWYSEHGELRVMFAQKDLYSGYMDKFFADHPRPTISWIHDIGRGRPAAASASLLEESTRAPELEVKQFMLSVGKLCQLAALQETETLPPLADDYLDAFHDGLDFVSVQEKMLQEMKAAIASVRGKQSLDSQVEKIAIAKGSKLQSREALLDVFKNLIRQMLQGRALSIEDAVDILTLKDNAEDIGDYTIALHLLSRATDQDIPSVRRKSSFRRVWCRIYNHDDWDEIRQTANVTDSQLNSKFRSTALYATLLVVLSNPHQLEGYDLEPSQALPVPLMPETSSRWPGMPQEQVEALGRDYRAESTELEQLRLEDIYHRVRELAVNDTMYGSGQ
ncbi:hypothetical protein SERLADRAFT_451525, partial [Serpula lacrymans var. lacrymans S7.9]